jgi:WD40 repeat protein
MDCLSTIDGPELPNMNVELSTACFLKKNSLLAIGTDIGLIFFWDLYRSSYLKIKEYNGNFRHKSYVSCIIYGKTKKGREMMFSCSHDGTILIWEIEHTEMKLGEYTKLKEDKEVNKMLSLKNVELSRNMLDKMTTKEMGELYRLYATELHEIDMNSRKKRGRGTGERRKSTVVGGVTTGLSYRSSVVEEDENYPANIKSIPSVKLPINTALVLGNDSSRLNVLAFSSDTNTLYSGGQDTHIRLWDIETGFLVDTLKGHKNSIQCMTFDKYLLFTGSSDGVINIWNTFDHTHLTTLGDYNEFNPIIDLMMIPQCGILASVSLDKRVNLWTYQSEKELIKSVQLKKECLCMSFVEAYGKLLFGTKDKTVVELDLNEMLESVGYKNSYKRSNPLDHEINYTKEPGKGIYFNLLGDFDIDNFKIMKLIVKDKID